MLLAAERNSLQDALPLSAPVWLSCCSRPPPAPSPTARPIRNGPTPIAPFKIADNLYYVGSQDLASYLIVTPAGDILINSSLTNLASADRE